MVGTLSQVLQLSLVWNQIHLHSPYIVRPHRYPQYYEEKGAQLVAHSVLLSLLFVGYVVQHLDLTLQVTVGGLVLST